MKVFYINLDRQKSTRGSAMEEHFSREALVRIRGVDGLDWALRERNGKGFYPWQNSTRETFVGDGILHPESKLYPTMVGCNLGHKLALEAGISSKESWFVVLEDDVEPTLAYRSSEGFSKCLEFPTGCDMLYLCSSDHHGRVIDCGSNGQVTRTATLMGYAVSRKAAKLLLDAMMPMREFFEFQGPVKCVESLDYRLKKSVFKHEGIKDKFKAHVVPSPGWIRLSSLSMESSTRPNR